MIANCLRYRFLFRVSMVFWPMKWVWVRPSNRLLFSVTLPKPIVCISYSSLVSCLIFKMIVIYFACLAVWGPFLIISPSSTLHNWQQEVARFVPDFKVVPYWGNPQVSFKFIPDRLILPFVCSTLFILSV